MSLKSDMIKEVSVDVGSISANTTGIVSVSVPGVKVGDFVYANKPSHSAGLGLANARVTAADTVELTFINTTGSAIDPAAETYKFLIVSI